MTTVVIVLSDEPYEASAIYGVFPDMDTVQAVIPGNWTGGPEWGYDAFASLPDHLRPNPSSILPPDRKFLLRAEIHTITESNDT